MRLTALFLALSACAPAAAAPPASAPASASPPAPAAAVPAPFTAEQIRDATAAGRTYRWRVDVPGEAPVVRETTFVQVDADGALLRTTTFDIRGAATGAPKDARVTWRELQSHGEFPPGTVKVTRDRVTVPAGTFDAVVYEVRDPAHPTKVDRYDFATSLPGAPVLMTTEDDGCRQRTTTLIEHRAR